MAYEGWDQTFRRDIDADTLNRAFRARVEAAAKDATKVVEEYRFHTAQALLSAGITLIPSEHLTDSQFVVSRGVYEAAKKITGF